ncbi:protein S100-Z [Festucalex cinctus]
MPSQLEGAMDALIAVFYNYSGHDGDKYKLNKGELKQLLHTELTDFLTSQKDPLLVEKIMSDLDSNKDNEVDFNEFVVLVAALTVACNDFFQEQKKKKTKREGDHQLAVQKSSTLLTRSLCSSWLSSRR